MQHSKLEIIKLLHQHGLDQIASFAIYDITDGQVEQYMQAKTSYLKRKVLTKDSIDFPKRYQNDELLADVINTDVMMLGLNAAERSIVPKPWTSFHDHSPHSKDRHIVFDLCHTKFKNGYMTDILKRLPVTDSNKINVDVIIKYMKMTDQEANDAIKNADEKTAQLIITARRSVKEFQFELDLMQPKVILQYHSKVVELLDLMQQNHLITLPKGCQLITQTHYSHPLYKNEQRVIDLVDESHQIFGK